MERSGQLCLAPEAGEQGGSFEQSPQLYVWVPLCLVQFATSFTIQYSSLEISPTFLILVSGSVKEVILWLYFGLNLWHC